MKRLLILILITLSLPAYSQLDVDSLLNSVKNRPLTSIENNYALTLTGYYDDCGEFGGHLETIEIKRIENQLVAVLTIYKKDCFNSRGKGPKVKKSKQYTLREHHIELIQMYLSELLTKTMGYNVIGHAGRIYSARLEFVEEDLLGEDPYTRLLLKYHDISASWNKFDELKGELAK